MHRKHADRLPYAALAFLLSFGAASLHAQSHSGASKSADISVSAGFSTAKPDYGPKRDFGGTIGVAYTRFFGSRFAPSFEIRANKYNGDVMNHEALMGGLRLQVDLRNRFHPYADFFYGAQRLVFKIPPTTVYTHDQGPMFAYGGGVDIDVRRNFQARIDILQENANYGPNGLQPNNADFTLAPVVITVGVNYRIPFRAHRSLR